MAAQIFLTGSSPVFNENKPVIEKFGFDIYLIFESDKISDKKK